MNIRSQLEIIQRIADIEASGEDIFGATRLDLIAALPFEVAQHNGWTSETATKEAWEERDETPEEACRGYLDFAIGKALDHRGLSAARSVDHLRAWTWLAGDHVYKLVIEEPEYAQYGVPHLKAAAEWCGYEWPTDDPHLERMAEGLECSPGCDMGCGA